MFSMHFSDPCLIVKCLPSFFLLNTFKVLWISQHSLFVVFYEGWDTILRRE